MRATSFPLWFLVKPDVFFTDAMQVWRSLHMKDMSCTGCKTGLNPLNMLKAQAEHRCKKIVQASTSGHSENGAQEICVEFSVCLTP